jgi:hypothetical protein
MQSVAWRQAAVEVLTTATGRAARPRESARTRTCQRDLVFALSVAGRGPPLGTEAHTVTFESPKLRQAAKDQACVRCGAQDGTVVGAHYSGVRRLALGGGFGRKVSDLFIADLCSRCHTFMDTLSRDKSRQYEHSEEFFFYIALTTERRFNQGVIEVARRS